MPTVTDLFLQARSNSRKETIPGPFAFFKTLSSYYLRSLPTEANTRSSGKRWRRPISKRAIRKKIERLYFLFEEDGLLHAEERAIPADPSPVREAESVIAELIKGPEMGYLSTIPPETRLRQIFITQDGTAYVDFSKEFAEKHPSGTSAEPATVYSIVNSLALNIPSIKKIVFLIEGGEKETLGGHINLSKPFIPLKSMIAE